MQTKEFLDLVWSDQGYYCVVSKDQHNNVSPVFLNSIDEILAKALTFNKNNLDIYFTCSTWVENTDRKAKNAKEQKIFWLDIDCGYDTKKRKWKDYRTKEEAMVALRNFTDVTKLPAPLIVDSGNGMHCYWPFTDPVASEVWKPIAQGLKFLCVKHGFKSDSVCTSDISRILRLPGTKNFKDLENPKDVVILQKGEAVPFDDLAALIPAEIVAHANTPRRPMDEATKAIMGNHTSRFRKIMERCKIDDGCKQLEHIATKQNEIEEPLWRAGLSIAVHCEDSDIAIHKISRNHVDYEYETTEKKAQGIPGPHSCKQFEMQRPEGCKNCVHKGKITSPIQLGRVIAKARGSDNVIEAKSEALNELVTFKIPDYPYPYFRGKNGGIYKTMPDDEDDGVKIYDYDFYLVERLNDPSLGECSWFKLHLPKDGVKEFIARTSDLLTRDKARQILVDYGVIVHGKQMDLMIDYIVNAVQTQQRTVEASPMYKQFGWNPGPIDKKNKILIGNREISAFGIKYVPVAEELNEVNPTLQKKGSFEEWKKGVAIYERKGMELRAFGFFCAFGSLLMPFFEHREKSAIINLYNPETGQGKTSVLQAMTSVYGNPDLNAKLIQLWGDTENSIIHRLGYMNNLPAAVDEMTNVTPTELHKFLKFISTGRGRNRLGNGVNRERLNDTVFNLICVVSSNTDFRQVMYSDRAKASGEMARFIQLRIELDESISKADADEHFSKFFDNYGHAGEIYAQHLIANLDKVKKQLKETQQTIDKQLNIKGQDRKYSATLASVFLGAIIAKHLGIHNIPIHPVFQAIAKELKKSKQSLKESDFDAMQTLGDFLNHSKNSTLVINSKADTRLGVSEAPLLRPTHDLKVRVEPDSNTIYIPASIMREYMDSKKIDYSDFIKGLKENKILRESSKLKVLHKGLEISGPSVRCIWIDNSTFDDIKLENLPLDIPKNVN
tara:strand:+ start:1899 stop:4751 length:2853 start_codon:yes stop_codon:yes gene_type:complete